MTVLDENGTHVVDLHPKAREETLVEARDLLQALVDAGPGGAGLTDAELRAVAVPVSGTFYQATQPVSGTFWQATQPVSGTVAVSSVGGSVAVTGTFYQATQPISAAALPLPSGASTETTLALIKAKTDNLDVALSTRAVTGLTDTQLRATPVPVSGTFYQATQPVSGTFWQATQPVSGTFWQATQPVSAASLPLPSGASTEATLSTLNGKVTACNTGAVTVSAITLPMLTKGTQGSTGFSTQDLKDAGRVLKTYTVSALACVTSEALISLTPYADLSAGSPATTFAVTSGKRLRIQAIVVTVRCTSTVNVGGIVRLRFLAGTVLVGSPVHGSAGCMGSALATAVAGNAQSFEMKIPDGLELSGSMQFGLTQLFSATTATIDVHVIGYEY